MIKDLMLQHKFKTSRDGHSDSIQDYIFNKLVINGSYRNLKPGDISILNELFKGDSRLSIIQSYTACYVGHFFNVTLNQALDFVGYLSDRDITPMLPKLNYTNATLPDFTLLLGVVQRKYPDRNTRRSMLYLIHERVKAASIHDNNFMAFDQWVAAIVIHPPTWAYFQHSLPFDEQLFLSFDDVASHFSEKIKRSVGQWMGHANSSQDNFQKWEMVREPQWNKTTYTRLWTAQKNGFDIQWHPHYELFVTASALFDGVQHVSDAYFVDHDALYASENTLYLP